LMMPVHLTRQRHPAIDYLHLDRVGHYAVPFEVSHGGQSDVVTRLRLACAALAKGDLAAVKDQTDRLERDAPLARRCGDHP